MMKELYLMVLIALYPICAIASEWTASKETDPMTDKVVSYISIVNDDGDRLLKDCSQNYFLFLGQDRFDSKRIGRASFVEITGRVGSDKPNEGMLWMVSKDRRSAQSSSSLSKDMASNPEFFAKFFNSDASSAFFTSNILMSGIGNKNEPVLLKAPTYRGFRFVKFNLKGWSKANNKMECSK